VGDAPSPLAPTLVIDHAAVGVCAAQYLLALGHRQLAVVVPREASRRDIGEAQLQGVESVAMSRGVEVGRVDLAFDEGEAARLAVRWAQQPHPSAVFTHNDEYGVLLMQALLDAGIAVPRQIALVGADDLPLSSLIRPRLTSIHVDVAASAETVSLLLHSMILGHEAEIDAVELLRPRIVPRESA
jgi:DNA-binding LacI/PurR family transcriptional regulator